MFLIFVSLTIFGFLGNTFSISLFFGVDFLFGSIATLIVLYFFGIAWGCIATVIAGGYTYLLWGHPYAVVIFVLETLFIGAFIHRRSQNLLLLDALYWLFLGAPAAWLFYGQVLDMNNVNTLLVILKQGINGVFNSLGATFLIACFPFEKYLNPSSKEKKLVAFRDILFSTMVALVLIPIICIMIADGRKDLKHMKEKTETEINELSYDIQRHILSWYNRHLFAVKRLAEYAEKTGTTPSKDLQESTKTIKNVFPDFHNMYVANEDATTVAFYPEINEKNESTLGISFADRDYFKSVKETMKPVVSEVFMGRGGVFNPIITISAPIIIGTQFKGYALGALNLHQIKKIILPYGEKNRRTITLIDSENRVVASSSDKLKFMEIFFVHQQKETMFLGGPLRMRLPDDEKLPEIIRYQRSSIIQNATVSKELNWQLIIEEPLAPQQHLLFLGYIWHFSMAAFLIVCSFIVAGFLSKLFTQPLVALAKVTKDLHSGDQIADPKDIKWPQTAVSDIQALCTNFQSLIIDLDHTLKELRSKSADLSEKIDHLQATKNALRESREKYRRLFEMDSDALFLIKNDTGEIIEINKAATLTYGYNRDELLQMKNVDVSVEPEETSLATAMRRNNVPVRYHRKKDGTIFPVEIKATHFNWYGEDVHLAAIRDISFRIMAEREKKDLETKLNRAYKMELIGTLAGGVAHDLNNILSGMINYPELLLIQLSEDSPLRPNIEKMKKTGLKAAAIVSDLLTLARGSMIQKNTLDFNEILSEYLNSPEYLMLKQYHPNTEIEVDTAADLLNIEGSSVHLSKMIMNLISNAAEAMPDGGPVTIATKNEYVDFTKSGYDTVAKGEYVTFSVTDTGIGIPREDLERIFEPFFTKKKLGRSGTGLGMSVVWNTVKDHGGYIDINSAEGQGTTIKIFFPVSKKEIIAYSDHFLIEDYIGKGESILVVDDVAEQREIASEMLKKLGYSVSAVSSGEAAVAFLKSNTADLLILDMIMDPGIDGLDTYKKIIEFRPGQKAIIVSGFSETDRVAEAQALGASQYLKKPYSIEKMGKTIKLALYGQH